GPGPDDGNPEQIGLELHKEVVRGGAAVDAQLGKLLAGVFLHGFEDFRALIRDGFESGARDVGARGASGQADDGPPRVRVPAGRAQTGERRNDEYVARIEHLVGQPFYFRGGWNELKLVP